MTMFPARSRGPRTSADGAVGRDGVRILEQVSRGRAKITSANFFGNDLLMEKRPATTREDGVPEVPLQTDRTTAPGWLADARHPVF